VSNLHGNQGIIPLTKEGGEYNPNKKFYKYYLTYYQKIAIYNLSKKSFRM